MVNPSARIGIRAAADIDAEWMTSALASAGIGVGSGARVAGLDATPIGSGQMGESARFRLSWTGGDDTTLLPETVVGKFPSSDPNSREAGRMGAYVREIGFYRDVQPWANVPTPEPYYIAFDDETADFVVIMSDLHPAAQGDQLSGCGLEEAEVAVEAIAGLHASTWGRVDDVANVPWLPRRSAEQVGVHAGRYRFLFDGFAREYSARIGTGNVELGRWIGDNFERLLVGHTLPDCVVHNDFRLDNVMFDLGGPRPATVVDWQTVGIGCGPVDVAYFVGAGLVPAPTDVQERELVERYRTRLAQLGVHADPDAVWSSYRLGAASGYVMAVIASQLVVRTERGYDMFTAMATRHADQMRRVSTTTALD